VTSAWALPSAATETTASSDRQALPPSQGAYPSGLDELAGGVWTAWMRYVPGTGTPVKVRQPTAPPLHLPRGTGQLPPETEPLPLPELETLSGEPRLSPLST
jgi:hypothetical protein